MKRLLDRPVRYRSDGELRRGPLRDALRALSADDDERGVRQLMNALSTSDRFRVFAELAAARGPGSDPGLVYEGGLGFVDVGADLGREARTAASALLARHRAHVPQGLRWPVYLALQRAGLTNDPRWDALFPLAFHDRDDSQCNKLVPLMKQALLELPETRREAAVLSALATDHHDVIRNGRQLLTVWPSAKVVELLLEKSSRRRELAARILDDVPALTRVVHALLARRPLPLVLRRGRERAWGARTRLSALEQAQLVAAGQRWDGQRHDAAARLGKSGDVEVALTPLDHLELTSAEGKVLYVALRWTDGGTVFAAGSTRVVASLSHGAVDCRNEALREALAEVLE